MKETTEAPKGHSANYFGGLLLHYLAILFFFYSFWAICLFPLSCSQRNAPVWISSLNFCIVLCIKYADTVLQLNRHGYGISETEIWLRRNGRREVLRGNAKLLKEDAKHIVREQKSSSKSSLATPAGQSFHLFSVISEHLLDRLAQNFVTFMLPRRWILPTLAILWHQLVDIFGRY